MLPAVLKGKDRIVYVLGLITHHWNFLEHCLDLIIWEYIGDWDRGMAVVHSLGNRSRAELVCNLAEASEHDRRVKTRVLRIAESFDILRENRNTVVHSHHVHVFGSHSLWTRKSKSKPDALVTTSLRITELTALAKAISGLQMNAFHLHRFLYNRRLTKPRPEDSTLPPIFPRPRRMVPNPPSRPNDQPRRKSSRKKVSKKAKV